MQSNVQRLLRPHDLAIHFDVIVLVRLRAKICADLAVNRDVTGRDQFITMAA